MTEQLNEISEGIRKTDVTRDLILEGARHIPKSTRGSLFSEKPRSRWSATGYLYESTVYEMIVGFAESGLLSSYVLRQEDVPTHLRRMPFTSSQNGFFYTGTGAITLRGDGIELREFDLLAFDSGGNPISIETMLSGNNLTGIAGEVRHRNDLLAYVLGKEATSIVVCPQDISQLKEIADLKKTERVEVVSTPSFFTALKKISPSDLQDIREIKHPRGKGVLATELRTKFFSYRELHRHLRAEFLLALREGTSLIDLRKNNAHSILQYLVLGRLDSRALSNVFQNKKLELMGRNLVLGDFRKYFTAIILGLTLPEFRPVLHLRSRDPVMYLDLGPFTPSLFGFEGYIPPRYTLFASWLDFEAAQGVTEELLVRVLESCLVDDVIGPRIETKGGEEGIIREILRIK